ncbi:MAG: hypothetical protein M3Q10_02910 [Chloroflexota bacterium]|nr:hypothetical protein [Chloroflexota bacterium]
MDGRWAVLVGVEAFGALGVLAQATPSGFDWTLIYGQYGAIVVLAVAVWWLAKQLGRRDETIERLNQESRDMAKAALEALKKAGKE